MGGHLATVRNVGENNFIYNTFAPSIPSATPHRFLWIGLQELENESAWFWVNGEPFVYSNWDPTQPDENAGNDEDRGGIALSPLPVGQWHDVLGINTSNDTGWGVVEFVPEPGSIFVVVGIVMLCRRIRRSNSSVNGAD